MYKVLVVDDHEVTCDLIEMYLDSYFEISPLIAHSGNEAIEILKENKDIKLILSDYNMPNGSGGDLYLHCSKNSLLDYFVLITAEPFDLLDEFNDLDNPTKFSYLQKPYNSEGFTSVVGKFIGYLENSKNIKDKGKIQDREFFKVKIKKFLKYVNCSVDVFLKLSSKKTIQISNREDKASKEQLERFIEKGEEYIYLSPKDFEIFINTGMEEAVKGIAVGSSVQIFDKQKNTVEAMHDAMKAFGVSDKVLSVADSCYEATLKNLNKNDKLKSFLPSFKSGEDNFKYDLSVATSYLSIALATKVSFCDKTSYEKFSTAALFQDLALNDVDLLQITDSASEETKDLNKNELKRVIEHPFKSVEILDKFDSISTDVKNMIIEHHERPNGSGFPRGLNQAKVAPLSCVFILANELANILLLEGISEKDFPKIKSYFKENFNKGNYRKVFDSFLRVFSNLS